MSDEMVVAVCPQCGGVTVVITNEFMDADDRTRLRKAERLGDTVEEIPRGMLSRMKVCHGHAVENGDLFGGGE